MQLNYEGHSDSPGIYKILNIHTNRIYIGQASCFKQRWYGHSRSLRSNKHQNKFIQSDFNKCLAELGHEDFLVFSVVESMVGSTKLQRKEREEHWITRFYDNQQRCYNFQKTASGTERSCRSFTPQETKTKQSIASKRVMTENPEFKAKSIEQLKSNWFDPVVVEKMTNARKEMWASAEFKRKRVEAMNSAENTARLSNVAASLWEDPLYREKNKTCAKPFHVIGPDGTHHKGISLNRFCKENNLSYFAMQRVIKGKTSATAAGWTAG